MANSENEEEIRSSHKSDMSKSNPDRNSIASDISTENMPDKLEISAKLQENLEILKRIKHDRSQSSTIIQSCPELPGRSHYMRMDSGSKPPTTPRNNEYDYRPSQELTNGNGRMCFSNPGTKNRDNEAKSFIKKPDDIDLSDYVAPDPPGNTKKYSNTWDANRSRYNGSHDERVTNGPGNDILSQNMSPLYSPEVMSIRSGTNKSARSCSNRESDNANSDYMNPFNGSIHSHDVRTSTTYNYGFPMAYEYQSANGNSTGSQWYTYDSRRQSNDYEEIDFEYRTERPSIVEGPSMKLTCLLQTHDSILALFLVSFTIAFWKIKEILDDDSSLEFASILLILHIILRLHCFQFKCSTCFTFKSSILNLLVAIKALILIAPLQFLILSHEMPKSRTTFAMLVTELLIMIFMMILNILHVAVHRDWERSLSQIKIRADSKGTCQGFSLCILDSFQCCSFLSTLFLTGLIIYQYSKLYDFQSDFIERYPKANFQFTLLVSFTLLFLQGCSERFLSIQTQNLYDSNHINSEFNLHSMYIFPSSQLLRCFQADKGRKLRSDATELAEFMQKNQIYYSLAMSQLILSLLCLITHYFFIIMCIYVTCEEDWSQHNNFIIFILWPFQFMEMGSTSVQTIHPDSTQIYFTLFLIPLAYLMSALMRYCYYEKYYLETEYGYSQMSNIMIAGNLAHNLAIHQH